MFGRNRPDFVGRVTIHLSVIDYLTSSLINYSFIHTSIQRKLHFSAGYCTMPYPITFRHLNPPFQRKCTINSSYLLHRIPTRQRRMTSSSNSQTTTPRHWHTGLQSFKCYQDKTSQHGGPDRKRTQDDSRRIPTRGGIFRRFPSQPNPVRPNAHQIETLGYKPMQYARKGQEGK